VGKQQGWVYVKGQDIPENEDDGWMKSTFGYWIFMINPGMLAGFTVTP